MIKLKIRYLIVGAMLIAISAPSVLAAGAKETGEGYLTYQPDGGLTAAKPTASLVWQFIKFILLFTLVVGLVVLVTRFLGQRYYRLSNGKSMRILDSVYLGPSRAVYAVEIGDAVLILGVTEHHVNLLTELSDGEQMEKVRSRAIADTPGATEWFGSVLGKALSVRKSGAREPGEFSAYFTQQMHRLQRLLREEENSRSSFNGRNGRDRAERNDNDERNK